MRESNKPNRITLPPTIRVALASIFLSPTMLVLLAVSAVSSFLVLSYLVDTMARQLLLYNLPELYAFSGLEGLSPAYAIMNMFEINFLLLLPFLLLIAAPLGYGISNIVTDDVGALPDVLLFSRPMSRWKFLLGNFVIRSAIIITVTLVIPILAVYPSAVSTMESASGSYITTKIPISQWIQMAWGAPLAELLILYSSTIIVVATIVLATSVILRRGVASIPITLLVVAIYPIITMATAFYAVPTPYTGGSAQSPIALLLLLTSPFRVFTNEVLYTYSFQNIFMASTVWWIILLLLSLVLYGKARLRT
jgi:hypothetical protein